MMALHIHRWLSSDEGRAERFEHHNHALVCSDCQTPKRLTGRPPTGISADDHVESLVGTEIGVKTGKINWTTGLTATTSSKAFNAPHIQVFKKDEGSWGIPSMARFMTRIQMTGS